MKKTFLLVGLLCFTSCGGDDGSPGDVPPPPGGGGPGGGGTGEFTAEDFVACGGDIVGEWNVTTTFVSGVPDANLLFGCPEATAVLTAGRQLGRLTFEADMNFSDATIVERSVSANIPAACFVGADSCEGLNVDGAEFSVACVGDIDIACDCDLEVMEAEVVDGTWISVGNTLELDPGSDTEYCVDGDRLTLRTSDFTGLTIVSVAQRL